MSASQNQSLDEDAVFQPVSETCPHFLYSEGERNALECLLSDGPGAFYMQLNAERLGPFLSPEEVNQLSGWAQDYHSSQVVVEEDIMEMAGCDQGDGEGQGIMDFSARYFPMHSDTPAPPLELGWPEKETWDCMGQATVYTSPPVEDAPPVREVVRKLLQGSRKVIAIVTDRLSDSAVISDLHSVASHGVPVYIILNQRSVQENFTPHRLRHPNMRVRVLGGKTFCSREGKMVVGELKDNFILVDLEKVMVGSYSLTWTDAHLHRQLVMVMSGPVVESFDREFRILYANSLPIPDTWKAGRPIGGLMIEGPVTTHCPKRLDLNSVKPLMMENIVSPPPSFTDQPIDWEALGVIQRGPDFAGFLTSPPPGLGEEPEHCYGPIFDEPLIIEEKPIPQQYPLHSNLVLPQEDRRGTNLAPGIVSMNNHIGFRPLWGMSSTDKLNQLESLRSPRGEPTPLCPNDRRLSNTDKVNEQEGMRGPRGEPTLLSLSGRRLSSTDKLSELEGGRSPRGKPTPPSPSSRGLFSAEKINKQEGVRSPQGEPTPPSPSSRRESDEISADQNETRPKPAKTKKPIILRVPQMDSFSSLSDILKKLQVRQSSNTAKRGPKSAVCDISRSMMDLSTSHTDSKHRLQASCYDGLSPTPAHALMKQRTDDKTNNFRAPKSFLPPMRPRSSTFGFMKDWRSPTKDQTNEEK